VLFSCNAQQPITGLQKQSKKPYNKQLINLSHSEFVGKSQTSALHIDLAIAQSIWQVLGMRFSCKDLTLS